MPTYEVTDPQTGQKLRLTGDSPPSEQELEQIFASQSSQPIPQETPPSFKSDLANRTDVGFEPLRSILSGVAAEPVAGIAGIGTLGGLSTTPPTVDSAVNNMNTVRDALTFTPRTPQGLQALQSFAETITPAAEKFQGAENTLGDIGYNIAGPIGGAIGKTLPTAALLATGTRPVRHGIKSALRSSKKPVGAVIKAHRLGYKVPPSLAKRSGTQQLAEGVAGPVPTKQAASIHNQTISNNLVKKDIGYPADVPLSPDGLDAVRAQLGQAYESVKAFGNIPVDKAFRKGLSSIGKKGSALSKEMPSLVKKDVSDLVKSFNRKNYSSEALVEGVKQLRADSKIGFKSSDPNITAMARAQGKIAGEMEKLIERTAAGKAPNLVPELKSARQTIAKTFQIQKALKGENVDAVALGRVLDKGKPMTGATRDVAEFGQHFKGAAQVNPPQSTNFRPMDLATGVAVAVASNDVRFLVAMGIRPALRKIILSKPYQKLVARMPTQDWEAVLSLPAQSQAAAMAFLLKDFKETESETQDNSQQ